MKIEHDQNQTVEIVLFQPDNVIRLDVRLENETVWLTQVQIDRLFWNRDTGYIKTYQ